MTEVKRNPIDPETLLTHVIVPAMIELVKYGIPPTWRAALLLLAICYQETDLQWSRQVGRDRRPGPATGRWQFEKNGGVAGVLQHPATRKIAESVLQVRGLDPRDITGVWLALERDDILAAIFARLLLWSDPKPLPDDETAGWQYYIRNWRPGRPHPEKWLPSFRLASATVDTHGGPHYA